MALAMSEVGEVVEVGETSDADAEEASAAAMAKSRRAGEGKTRYFTGSIIPSMDGLHLTADLRDCDPSRDAMTDPQALRKLCLDGARAAGLQPVGELFHRFPPPGGVTGVVLLAESHAAVHTWPELGAVTLDVYVCNLGGDNSQRAQALMASLAAAFGPASAQHHALRRGTPAKAPA